MTILPVRECTDSLKVLGTMGLGVTDVRAAVEKLKGSPQVVLSPRPSPYHGPEGESSPEEQLAQLASDDGDDDSLYEDY